MGDPQLDDAVANLQRFNQSLAGLTPRLEEAAEELAGHVGGLQSAAGELRGKLAEARSGAGELDSEASTFAGAAETAAGTVEATVMGDVDGALTTLDASVRELVEGVPHEVNGRAASLEHDLQELQTEGFAAVHTSLADLGALFGTWTEAAEEPLEALDGELQTVTDQLAADRELLDDSSLFMLQHGTLSMSQATFGVGEGLSSNFAQGPLGTDLTNLQQTISQQAETATHGTRAEIAQITYEVREEISPRTLALLDSVGTVVDSCEVAEHGAGEAEQEATSAEQRAGALVDLAARIDVGDGELQQIQSVVQAMDSP